MKNNLEKRPAATETHKMNLAVEMFRTAPVGLSALSATAGLVAAELTEFNSNLEMGLISSVAAILCARGIRETANSFMYKSRISKIIDKRGFSPWAMENGINFWCERQVGKLVCEKAGYAEEYSGLIESTKTDHEFGWLPNF